MEAASQGACGARRLRADGLVAEGPGGRPAARRRPPRARHRAPPSGFGVPAPCPAGSRRRNTTHARRGIPSSKPSSSPRGESLNTSVIKRTRHVNTRSGTNRAEAAPRRYVRKHIPAHGSTPPADRPTPCARTQACAARMPSVRVRPAVRGHAVSRDAARTRPIAQFPAPLPAGTHPAAAATGASPPVVAAGRRTTDAAPTRQGQGRGRAGQGRGRAGRGRAGARPPACHDCGPPRPPPGGTGWPRRHLAPPSSGAPAHRASGPPGTPAPGRF